MSKFQKLWEYIENTNDNKLSLTFEELEKIAGVPLDHSFLSYKKELEAYGWAVKKRRISLKCSYSGIAGRNRCSL